MFDIQSYFKRDDNQSSFIFSLLTSLFLGNAIIFYYNLKQDSDLYYYRVVIISFATIFFHFLFFKLFSVFKNTTYLNAFFNYVLLFLLIEFFGGSVSFAMYYLSFASENGFLLEIIFAVVGGAMGALIFIIRFLPGTLLFALINIFWVVMYQKVRKQNKSI